MMVLGFSIALGSDLPKLSEVFRNLRPRYLIASFFCMGAAYLAFALSFNGLFKTTPYRVPFPRFFSIMFISATVNFIVSSGGMSSIALRSFLFKQEKVPYSVTIPLSFAQNMIFNLVLSCVCIGGLFYLRNNPLFMTGAGQAAVLTFLIGLLLVVAAMLLVFFNTSFRRWFLKQLLRSAHWFRAHILKKGSDHERFAAIHDKLETTVKFLHQGWLQLLAVLFWVSLDWCFTALCLYFCFHAVGVSLSLGLLLVGFTVMSLSSNINVVPAGLGVSESLLAFTYSRLGVGFEATIIAALLYRFVFFLIPLALSSVLYLDILRSFFKKKPR